MREKILTYLGQQAVLLHGKFRKSTLPWNLEVKDLETYAPHTLGNALFNFYNSNQFTPIGKMEYHDVDHLLLQYGSDVKGEMMLQWFVLGNGKKTFFAILACIPSVCIMPEMWGKCLSAYKRGKLFHPIWHIDYRTEFSTPLEEARRKILVPIASSQNNIKSCKQFKTT